MKKKLLLLMGILMICLNCSAQKTRKGPYIAIRVLSAKTRTPLAGSSISMEGDHKSGITNGAGEFKISQPILSDTVTISHVGYIAERIKITPRSLSPLIILLHEKTSELNEVVVSTGYQSIPKERATGSFEQISSKLLSLSNSPDIIDRLQGVSSILFNNKGTQPPITIRGLSTINGNSAPLIVVDNFPYEGNIDNIDPNDIKSVTILKDAAAASIWGTKAGNGVVVITTKKGRFNQPLTVALNTSLTITPPPDLSYLHPISSNDFVDFEKFLYSKGYYNNEINSIYRPLLSPVVELLIKESDGQMNKSDADAEINSLKKIDVRNDYDKYFFQTGVEQQHSLNLSGGTSNFSYDLAGGFENNLDVLASRSSRIHFSDQNEFRPVKNFMISTKLQYTATTNVTGKPTFNSIEPGGKALYPYARLVNNNGEPLPLDMYRKAYIDTVGQGKLLDWNYYPYDDWKHDYTTLNSKDLLANLDLSYKFLSHFSINLKYQFEDQATTRDQLHDAQSYYSRNLINRFSQIDYASGAVTYKVPMSGILDKTAEDIQSQSARAQINYNDSWNKNEISAIMGGEIRSLKDNSDAYRIYGYDKNTLTEGQVDYVNPYPTVIGGAYSFIPDISGLTGIMNHYVSFYANAAYTYDSRITLSASVRRDASNLFGVATNDKWTPLWSVGTAWNISNEKFYHLKFLPYLKIKATYGYSGNVDQSKSAVTTIRLGYSANYTHLPSAAVTQFDNPSLRWERVGMFNLGIYFSAINHILSGSIEYYHKRGLDLIGPSLVDYTSLPALSIEKNVANMAGNGIDANLTARIFNRGVQWTSSLLFSYNKMLITKYYTTSQSASDFVGDGEVIDPMKGQPVYSVISFKWKGLDPKNGNPQGLLNKQISEDYADMFYSPINNNLVYSGSATPTIYGYLNNTFFWKNLSITPCIAFRMGYYFMKPTIDYSSLIQRWQGNNDYDKRWQKPGDEKNTYVPSFIYPDNSLRDGFYTNSSVLVRNADNIRLNYINVAYDLRKGQLRKIFSTCQIYVIASHLGILWRANKDGIDPDYNQSIPPPSMSISFGIKATF